MRYGQDASEEEEEGKWVWKYQWPVEVGSPGRLKQIGLGGM